LSGRFLKLETRYNEKIKEVDAIAAQQKTDGTLIAVHTKQLEALASINEKLDALPRREEIDHRFSGIELALQKQSR
jgi:hypothetical protein